MIVTTNEDRKRKIKAFVGLMIENLGNVIADVELDHLDSAQTNLECVSEHLEMVQDEVFVLQEGEED